MSKNKEIRKTKTKYPCREYTTTLFLLPFFFSFFPPLFFLGIFFQSKREFYVVRFDVLHSWVSVMANVI